MLTWKGEPLPDIGGGSFYFGGMSRRMIKIFENSSVCLHGKIKDSWKDFDMRLVDKTDGINDEKSIYMKAFPTLCKKGDNEIDNLWRARL